MYELAIVKEAICTGRTLKHLHFANGALKCELAMSTAMNSAFISFENVATSKMKEA